MSDHLGGTSNIEADWGSNPCYPSQVKLEDCKDLLRKCLVVFNDLPDTLVKGSRGLTTHKIVDQIKELLK